MQRSTHVPANKQQMHWHICCRGQMQRGSITLLVWQNVCHPSIWRHENSHMACLYFLGYSTCLNDSSNKTGYSYYSHYTVFACRCLEVLKIGGCEGCHQVWRSKICTRTSWWRPEQTSYLWIPHLCLKDCKCLELTIKEQTSTSPLVQTVLFTHVSYVIFFAGRKLHLARERCTYCSKTTWHQNTSHKTLVSVHHPPCCR